MQWLRAHLLLAFLGSAGVLIVIGAFIVSQRVSVVPQARTPRAWSGIGANLLNPSSNAADQRAADRENIYTQVQNTAPFHYAPEQAQIPLQNTSDTNFDFAGFLLSLTHTSGNTSQTSKEESGGSLDPYSFIPTGLVSVSGSEKERTEAQQAIFNYANEAASNIETHEERYRSAARILKDQFEDPQDPGKNSALQGLAQSLSGVGSALLAIEEVPAEVKDANQRLAKSYQDMGQKLSLIPGAKDEKTLLDAMLSYNAAVEGFTKNFTALATLLSVQGITFKSDDPGSIFTFKASSF